MKLFTLFILIITYHYSSAQLFGLFGRIFEDLDNEIQDTIKKFGTPFKDLVIPPGFDISDIFNFKTFDPLSLDGNPLNPLNFSIDNVFNRFSAKYKVKYSKGEEKQRKQNLFNSLEVIARSIIGSQDSNPNYKLGLTSLADKSPEEYRKLLGTRIPAEVVNSGSGRRRRDALPDSQCQPINTSPLPSSFDWRNRNGANYVSSVKNQNPCDSCWTFAAVAALESQYLIRKGQLLDLSEQELVNCVNPGVTGCGSGGSYYTAFDYIINKGLSSEASVPYTTTRQDYACRVTPKVIPANSIGYCRKGGTYIYNYGTPQEYTRTFTLTDQEIMTYIRDNGPVTASINADMVELPLYDDGFFDDYRCNNRAEDLNHAITIVGWNTVNGIDYWIIKNSWGADWGVDGYLYLARGSNMCGINTRLGYLKLK